MSALLVGALSIVATASPSAAPPSAGPCKAAVLDLQPGEGVTLERARALTEVVTTEVARHLLADSGGCTVLSRAEIQALVSFEAEREMAGCDTTSCLGEIGDALGVDRVVLGTIARVDDRTLVSLRLVNMKTMVVQRRVTDSFVGRDDDALPWIAWLATRVSVDDEASAGVRPVVDAPTVVERKATVWRALAWTGVGTGAGVLVVAGALGGAALGISAALPSIKTARTTDRAQIEGLEGDGPWLAGGANLGLYLGVGLVVVGGALFFAPGDELVRDSPASAMPASAMPASAMPASAR